MVHEIARSVPTRRALSFGMRVAGGSQRMQGTCHGRSQPQQGEGGVYKGMEGREKGNIPEYIFPTL